ncbi:MAG: hypothetical protein FWD31_12010 [Planctomycetaceae bacterium]|nr:hypothetical protein [Planctomycetaceae bacterium]
MPIINILRTRYPYAKIAWLSSSEMIEFLNRYDIADRLSIAKPGWYKKLSEIQALRKRLLSFEPDLCLDLQGDLASALAVKLSGCRKQISVHGTRSRLFGKSTTLRQATECQREKRLHLLETLGVAGASIDYHLPEIPGERRAVDGMVRELDLESTPFAMLGVGVQSNSSYWEVGRYVQVAEHLGRRLRLPTIVTWQSERERQIAEKIVAESGDMIAMAPALSAIQFAALARRTSIFVGGDNDFLHLATAVGASCIGVFCGDRSRHDVPHCNNFQLVQAQSGETRHNRRGANRENDPIRIDNYTYDVIRVCNACDDILQPESIPESLPDRQPVGI